MADNNGTNVAVANEGQQTQTTVNTQQQETGGATTSIDYEKIADILDGRMKATEDSFLKGYFKEQGLSKDEMAQAIKMFKEDKASKTPDVDALNAQIAAANQKALRAELELKATGIATELGVSAAKIPYLLKMADMEKSVKDEKIDKSKLKEALETVLKDVPELKEKSEAQLGGIKVGLGSQGENNNPDKLNSQLAHVFGVKTK